ncbi:MAG: SUF system NifU family Fe-S cluster assembly protein [Candidatus Obscuribacterales bacterium]|nr:SUF system NifU family Fe-S cluster assembly protein [Candidatus Obscuribacterales bacterium]
MAMSLADDLYRETILDHYHNPRNHGIIDNPSAKVEGVNPLCGDELTLYLTVENGTVVDVKLEAKGCSINTASGSMMTEAVVGKSVDEATDIINKFKSMMLDKNQSELDLPEEMEDLEALQGVKKYPVRIKCALLPWNTLIEGLESVGQQK